MNQSSRQAWDACRHQEKTGCGAGSWDAANDRWFSYGGRAAATAMNVLTLEVYYRYATPDELAGVQSNTKAR